MTTKLAVSVLLFALAPAIAAAQKTILLSSDDLYFAAQLAKKPLPSRTGATDSAANAPTRICGFQIRGNHQSRANPRVEWDINIDEINLETGRIAGVTAGTFDVAGHGRKARPAIVELGFSIEGSPQAIPARIVGAPNADNGIKAMLETDPANQLFAALSTDAHLISISMKYADDTVEVLQIRPNHDWRKFAGEKNSMFQECLRGYTPVGNIKRAMP
jgi:hypothetical protein